MSEQNDKLMELFPWRTVGMRVVDTLRIVSDAEGDGFSGRDDMMLVDTRRGRLKFDQERVRNFLMLPGSDYTRALRHSGAHDIVIEEFAAPHANSARQPLAHTWVGPVNVVVSKVASPDVNADAARLGWEAYARRLRFSRLAETSADRRGGTTSSHRRDARADRGGTTGAPAPAGGAAAAASAAVPSGGTDSAAEPGPDAATPAGATAGAEAAPAGAGGDDDAHAAPEAPAELLEEGTVREGGLEDVVCNEYFIIPEVIEFKPLDGRQWVRQDEGSPWKAAGPPLMLLYRVSMVTSEGSLLPPPAQLHEMIVFVKEADSRRVSMVAQRCWVEEGPGLNTALRDTVEPVVREVQQAVLRRFLGELANIASGSGNADVEAKADMATEDDDLDDHARARRLADAEMAEPERKDSKGDLRSALAGAPGEEGEEGEEGGIGTDGVARGRGGRRGASGEALGAGVGRGSGEADGDAADEAAAAAGLGGLASLKGAGPADRMRAHFMEEELLRVAARNAHVRARARVNRLARADKAQRNLRVLGALARVAGRVNSVTRAAQEMARGPLPEVEGEDDVDSDEEQAGAVAGRSRGGAGPGRGGRGGRAARAGSGRSRDTDALLTFECHVGVPKLWRGDAKAAADEVPEVALPDPWIPGVMVPAVGDEDLSESMSDQAWGRFCSVDMMGWGSATEDEATQEALAVVRREQERRQAAEAAAEAAEALARQREAEAAAEAARQADEDKQSLLDKRRLPGESLAASLARQLGGTAAAAAAASAAPDRSDSTAGPSSHGAAGGGGDSADGARGTSADAEATSAAADEDGDDHASESKVGGAAHAEDSSAGAGAGAGGEAGAVAEQQPAGAASAAAPGGPQSKDAAAGGGGAAADEKVWAVNEDGDFDWEPTAASPAGEEAGAGEGSGASESKEGATAVAVAVGSGADDSGASLAGAGEGADEDEFGLRQPRVLGIPQDAPSESKGRLTGDAMLAAIVLGAERRQLAEEQARLKAERAARAQQLAKERAVQAEEAAKKKARAKELASIPPQDSVPPSALGAGVDEEDEAKLKFAASNDPSIRACSTDAACVCM
ncbi:hypothetical protein FNF27_02572 [Cafeteria roenbergensis]|uniref:VASt domain-containing protein n=2 Tax=Cafeteria roenbergensis TaxID=33653 RepID=A0A5A8EJ77_CAFRO|nr:hypothetical protein FNF27_02572 [Cafeteria roenbergensis]